MDESDDYSMENTFRGHAVIIANEAFGAGISNRLGARKDALKMRALFQALDFHVISFMDLTAKQMTDAFKNASESLINLDADCFVLVISSHGHEEKVREGQSNSNACMYLPNDAEVWRHVILGVDGQPVYVDDMLAVFDDKKNKQSYLSGKPKLFFLQACRSGHLSFRKGMVESIDMGVNAKVSISGVNLSQMQPSDAGLHDDEFAELVNSLAGLKLSQEAENATDTWCPDRRVTYDHLTVESEVEVDVNPVAPRVTKPTSYDIVPVPCPDDCLIMYPVVSGKVAFRVSETGSFMINYMFHEMNRNLLFQGCDILEYVTAVNKAMVNTDIYIDPRKITEVPEEIQMLQDNLPFKMSACVIHRLTKSLKFQPKRDRSVMQDLKTRKTF